MKFVSKMAAACLLIALLAACGGGGGGGPPAAGGPGAAAPAHGISYYDADLKLLDTAKMSADVSEEAPHVATVTVTVTFPSSDAAMQLASQKIYVVVEDPASLFVAPIGPRVDQYTPTTFRAGIELPLRPQVPIGNYQGQLRIFVCLDSSCTTQFRGSPMTVPYAINRFGIKASVEPIAVSTPFATSATRTITAELPNSLVEFRVNMETLLRDPFPVSTKTTASFSRSAPLAGTSTATVTVDFPVRSLGSYSNMLVLYAVHRKPDGTEVMVTKKVALSQTVTKADTPDYAIVPSEVHLSRSLAAGPNLIFDRMFSLIENEGIRLRAMPAEYLSSPAAAAGHPLLNTWVYDDYPHGHLAANCRGSGNSSICLPVGRYTARIPVNVERNNVVTRTVYLPVTLDVVP